MNFYQSFVTITSIICVIGALLYIYEYHYPKQGSTHGKEDLSKEISKLKEILAQVQKPQPNFQEKKDSNGNSPLKIELMNIVTFLMFYSPIIISVFVLSISFISQNFKGLIYLAFLIFLSLIRSFVIFSTYNEKNSANTQYKSPNDICNMIQYSKYGNAGFSIFVTSFTFMYLCMPMFMNNNINFSLFGGLLAYLIADIAIRYSKKCIVSVSNIIFNIIGGASLGAFIPWLFYTSGGANFMFFNEINGNKDVCSMPQKQKFVCKTYRNGELISSQ